MLHMNIRFPPHPSKNLAVELEHLVDQTFLRHPLPHPNRAIAIWYCLTASEDAQRIMFTDLGAHIPFGNIIFYLDRYKYSMRYVLERISKEARDFTFAEVPRQVVPKLYKRAAAIMSGGVDHALATQIFGAIHTGTGTVVRDKDAWRIRLDEAHHDKSYGALELIGVPKPKTTDFAALLFQWIRSPSTAPRAVNRIAASVRVDKALIAYEYQQDLAYELAQHVPQPPPLIPVGWQFPWGGRAEVTLLLNSLSLRCLYHIVAIHFGARARGLRGGGAANIVLVIKREQLISELASMSSLDGTKIRTFVDNLRLGYNTSTPDPALQPIVPLGPNLYAVPCIHLLSSSQERNLLSLFARTQPSAFNSQSHLFEEDMVATLMSSNLPPRTERRANITVRVAGEKEEIDFVLVDRRDRRLLICELRWMLGPGDPREVQNRKKECLKKVDQVRRKVTRLSTEPATVVAAALRNKGTGDTNDGWCVTGLVLIAGYGGTRSPDERFPIIPVTLFEKAMSKASSLTTLAAWCHGSSWLPQEGVHFRVASQTIEIEGGTPLVLEGLSIPDSASHFSSDAVAILSKEETPKIQE